jgi:cupin fold WbuC family metalloprotein
MKRDDKSNVKPHRHNYIARKIEGTHEIILFLSGEAEILFYEPDGELIKSIIVNAPCLVFFNGGCHAIKFHKECELVEIKQGPYLATEDKVILNLRDNNDSRI